VRSTLQTAAVAASLLALAACSSVTTGTTPPAVTAETASVLGSLASEAGGFVLPDNVRRACAPTTDPGLRACDALIRTDVRPDAPSGYGPSDLQSAYQLPSSTAGSGQTIAVVDAFDDPNAEADLAVYRSTFGLPACTSTDGCFAKVNQKGKQGPYPRPDAGWAGEESLDVDMVSAICPNCHIILAEANTNSGANLGKTVDTAVKLGANAVSNSYGGGGYGNGQYFDHPGTIITASAGDGGYGISDPALFPTVVAVGGTTLRRASGSRGWTETVWRGTGSGCAGKATKPAWQTDHGCKGRTMNDVAADADPNTGVASYDSYPNGGWGVVGGTSVSSPIIASVYGLAGNAGTLNAAQSLYAKNASLYDVTAGTNGTCKKAYLCTGEVGYDGPTGNGTPNGSTAF
jgi:subtilase family serine protease